LRAEAQARGQNQSTFEVGSPPPLRQATATTGSERVLLLESNEECAQPELVGLRRHLLSDGAATLILPGTGLCARTAAATAIALGHRFGPLTASYKEYEDAAVLLARAGPPPAARRAGAGGRAPPQSVRPPVGGEGAVVARWVEEAEKVYAAAARSHKLA
jgi:hypothetical protein